MNLAFATALFAIPAAGAHADVMTGPGSSSGSGSTTGSTTGSSSSSKASSGSGSTSSSTGSGGADGGSSGGCSVQPQQTAGAIGLAAIPAAALIAWGLRRRKKN
jgi:hypothetical protein